MFVNELHQGGIRALLDYAMPRFQNIARAELAARRRQ